MITSTTQQNVMSLRGLSTDTKPVNQSWLENGSSFLEMDTGKVFVYDGENKEWIEQADGGPGAQIVIDDAMSSTSENPVQNKVIYGVLQNKADLVNGKVSEQQLPSYVDDVINGYYDSVTGKFYEHYESGSYSDEITPEDGKIYVDLTTNVTFRWSGSVYVQVGPEGEVVIANPTLDGTEADLTGLQVGNTKYKAGGGHLYRHDLLFDVNGIGYLSVCILNNSSSNIITNKYTIIKYLKDNNYDENHPLSCNGCSATTSFGGIHNIIVSIYCYNDNTVDYLGYHYINYLSDTKGHSYSTNPSLVGEAIIQIL